MRRRTRVRRAASTATNRVASVRAADRRRIVSVRLADRRVASVHSADAVLNALPHPVLTVGPNGHIADANAAAEAFFESGLPVLRRHPIHDFVPFGSPMLALIEQVRSRGAKL